MILMKQQIKEDLHILFLKDIGHLLLEEEIKYMIVENEDKIDVKELPIYYNDYLYLLYDYLAYDFDELNPDTQKKYMLEIDIKDIWNSLGEITGDTYDDELVDNIFKHFCLGK